MCVLCLQECAMYVAGKRAATESGSMSRWHNLPTSAPEKSRTFLAKVVVSPGYSLHSWCSYCWFLFALSQSFIWRNWQLAAMGSEQIIAGMHGRQVGMCTRNSFPCTCWPCALPCSGIGAATRRWMMAALVRPCSGSPCDTYL